MRNVKSSGSFRKISFIHSFIYQYALNTYDGTGAGLDTRETKMVHGNMCVLHAKLLQLCLTLCDPRDHSLPRSSVHGILQVRLLEWIALPSSSGSF